MMRKRVDMWFGAKRDDGFALIFVIGAAALITAVAIAGYAIARQTLNDSVREGDVSHAYQAASTGLETEITNFTPGNMASRYPLAATLPNGDTYYVTVSSLGGGMYEMRSMGVSRGVTDTVLTQFQSLNLWDMNISGGESSSMGVKNGFNGNSIIIGSLYVNGSMDWGANGELWGGPVFVNGTWNASGSGEVGSPSNRVDAYGPVPSDNINYFTNLKGNAPDIEMPTLTVDNMDTYLEYAQNYATANPRTEPVSGIAPATQSATYYTVFDGDTTFDENFGDPANDAIAVNGGIVYLRSNAIIFVDGTVTFGPSITGYRGAGTIVARDGVVVTESLLPQNGLSETRYGYTLPKMDAQAVLGLLTLGDVTAIGKADAICAAVFMNGNYNVPANAHSDFIGSMICNSIQIQTTNCLVANQQGLADILPEGMPDLSSLIAQGDWVRR